ncbi:2-dehydropantoate 2-reductase family protein [Ophiobolus disseminans]|uniref:2-dehydropantoate 2-reductase n=1 Tax=Ophiobolus disseminans TaxID=1469910 RepID=A0A6A6ZLM8_9PLEO|nr:2-dehydropantoate 2-reductase family protein [Ophiobolus disseminans]
MRLSPTWRSIADATTPGRVHVLGLGSIGTFAAHALAEVPKPAQVTLLLHRPNLMDEYVRNGRQVLLKTRQGESVACSGYEFESLQDEKWYRTDPSLKMSSKPAFDTIQDVILCVKTTQTVAALRPLVARLTPESSIMFLQNGAGMIEDVNEHLFPEIKSRPNYITGVISHGVTLNSPFNITHTGAAATSIGLVPRHGAPRNNESSSILPRVSSYITRALPRVPRFNCRTYDWPDILQIQLEKLAVNAVSNPLCALSNTVTDYVFTIPEICRALISEISAVAQALPELKGVSGVAKRFSPEVLGSTVMTILDQNRETTCSMVWDMRAGRETEIRYINGYWSRRGRELGVLTPINDDLVARIEARTAELRRSK